ncbi:Tudor/PWWP/MBT superfamily protein [Citrus sinensis]|uniref:Tudor/PWWP/MBT superfamily protein n=1 Tax=Citrus sinensis TaxID=2711 RepID=A0ACB8JDE6_CITSI|nr:Tudor/PWWP/MBT superfamily protein [Citrus sinensis]
MGSSKREIELEEQLKDAGNLLLNPPSPVDEVINLLDKVEHLLANVEQAPSRSMRDALLPTMKGLITNDLLRHSDMDVRLLVTSCISEITRITAPDSPYDDELMKEFFQLAVSAFENLSHASGRYYMKALSILDTVAKVRSCLLMLDLECDKLVVEMFQHFLKVTRSNHPHFVFAAMETIMTLVIDESEDVSWDLLRILLASVRKENQDVSPTSWKLGEKVFTKCAAKLKTNLKEAVQSRGIALDDYAEIVACICGSDDENPQHGHLIGSENQLATKEPDPPCLGEVVHDVDGISKSVTSNGTAASRNEDSVVKDKLSNVLERCSQVERSQSIDAKCSAGPDTSDSLRNVKSETEPESAPRKRGRKPNSLMNPEEGYDHSWISSGRKIAKVPGRRKSDDKGVDCSPSLNQDSKKEALNLTDKMLADPTSASLKSGLPDGSHHRRGRTKKQGSTVNQNADHNSLSVSLSTRVEETASGSADFSLRKKPEDRSDTEIKHRKRSKTNEEISQPPGYGVSEKEAEVPSADKEKPLQLSVTKKRRRSLVVAISAQNISEASGGKKKKTSKGAVKSPNIDENYSEDTPKTEIKRKHTSGKEEVWKKMISKARAKSSDRDGSHSKETPKSEVKKHSVGKEKKKVISKAIAKSSNKNHLEETPTTEIKKKLTARKEEKKKISKAGAKSLDGNCSAETPKTGVKRKLTAGKEMVMLWLDEGGSVLEFVVIVVQRTTVIVAYGDSEAPALNEQLVGSRIKVWWPMDETFYKGVVDNYDPIKKKHRILYADGDEEILNLKKERWELIKGGSSAEEQETDVLKPDGSSDILPKGKEEIEFELVNEVKASALKRSTPASASKPKAKKSGGGSPAGATINKPINADESKADLPEKESNPKGDDQNSPAKLILKDRKLIFTLNKQQVVFKGERHNACDGESAVDNPVERSKEAVKGSSSNDVGTIVMDDEK